MKERGRNLALGTRWERQSVLVSRMFAAAVALGGLLLAVLLRRDPVLSVLAMGGGGLAAWGAWWFALRALRRRRALVAAPFPAEWEAVLARDVAFFRGLEPAEQERFRTELKVFLGEKRITGIRMQLDTRIRVLVGASAVIPIFGFPEWEWGEVREVLVYPRRFDLEFQMDGDAKRIMGMVGSGAMEGVVILVAPDLIHGFTNAGDKRNVGVHEFAHLVDKRDGRIDGVPGVGLTRECVGPWLELVRRNMREIETGDSDLNRYALTNEAEFFSVASEYFFERPGVMRDKHPELFAMLERVFAQDMGSRVGALRRAITARPKRLGRNSPCPCGSGRKYKKCCLDKS